MQKQKGGGETTTWIHWVEQIILADQNVGIFKTLQF